MSTARLRSFIGAAGVSAALIFVAPATAQASTIYPPAGSCTASPTTAQPGATFAFACEEATFSAGEQVTITVTGENGADAAIGAVRFAISTAGGQGRSQSDGSLTSIPITLPTNASGTYNVAAVSPTSAGGTAAVSVTGGSASALPLTGMDAASLAPLLIGGGALLLAGVVLAVVSAVRRSRQRD